MSTFKDTYAAYSEYKPFLVDRFDRIIPGVSGFSNLLKAVLSEEIFKRGFRPKYKEGRKYGVCLSHDIDFLYEPKNKNSFFISMLGAVKRGNLSGIKYNVKNIIQPQVNPDWMLDHLMSTEEKFDIQSTYFFLCLDKDEEDHNYHIASLKEYIVELDRRGCEIGLHGGLGAYNNVSKIEAERCKLERVLGDKVLGYRNHYLKFSTPQTWRCLHELGFAYDTSYGHANFAGYRNGLCYPFRPIDLNTQTYIDIIELPLHVMDVTFFKHMGLATDQALCLFKKILADVKRLNGVLTINWHNNNLDGEYRELYELIMGIIAQDEDAWITTSLEMTNWWRNTNMESMEEIVSSVLNSEIVVA
jgi:peptidoglycan/xylan/chitin deacetylase (PgdA/CDA1 family)